MAQKNTNFSRRNLLKSVAAGIALPYLISPRAMGADGKAPPSDQVNIGIIGLGGRARSMADTCRAISALKVSAVCDCLKPRCDSFVASKGKGLNWRTNLYYIETDDLGKTWRSADGRQLTLPLTKPTSPALVHDYQEEGLNVYLKDIRLDAQERPVILFITSKGYESGPRNDPRTWTTARWTGAQWQIRPAFFSDNNYDMGSLYIEDDRTWRVIAPTETGPHGDPTDIDSRRRRSPSRDPARGPGGMDPDAEGAA